jgi:hypothetical protein
VIQHGPSEVVGAVINAIPLTATGINLQIALSATMIWVVHTSAPKKTCLTIPKCTLVVLGEMAIYSTNTSTRNDRCLFVIGSNCKICRHQTCKNQRAILANSQKLEEFDCKHLKVFKDLSMFASYPCDDTTKAKLMQLHKKCGEILPIAVQVSTTMYCVFETPTANNTVGYCHGGHCTMLFQRL